MRRQWLIDYMKEVSRSMLLLQVLHDVQEKLLSNLPKKYKKEKDELVLKTELYMASDEAFNNVIEKLNDDFDCVAVFSHNPGITDFANSLTDARTDNIPTCGIFAVSIDAKKWGKFKDAKKNFLFFDYPKALVE